MTICIKQFPCSLCYIELSSLYLKVAKRHENIINFNISLKKKTTTFKFAHALSVAEKMVYLEVCKFEKKILPVGNIFFANTIA